MGGKLTSHGTGRLTDLPWAASSHIECRVLIRMPLCAMVRWPLCRVAVRERAVSRLQGQGSGTDQMKRRLVKKYGIMKFASS
jgi:hypothetical protein